MSDDADGVHELVDAASVAARREVVQAVAALAVSPLDEQAADLMRAALTRATSPAVKRAADRIGASRGKAAARRAALVCLQSAAKEETAVVTPVSEAGGSVQVSPAVGIGVAVGDVG